MSRVSVQLFAFNAAIAKELKYKIVDLASGKRTPLATPSAYQQRIFDFIAAGRGSVVVKAVAGSGKTTTILEALRYIPGVDLSQVRAGTFHSVGFAAVLKKLNLAYSQVSPDGSKVRKLLRDGLGEIEYDLYADFVCKLVDHAKGAGIGALIPDLPEYWYEIISHHDLFLDSEAATEERAVELARKFLRVSNEVAKNGTIDFHDMLYLPLLWRLRLWQNDYVFVDEAQDTNPVRRALAKLALRPGGRLIAVGDDRQAIYGFTGASHDAMDLIREEFSCVELPLTVSYRCPVAVGEKARELVPYFETALEAKQGVVEELSFDDTVKRLGPHDAILCRNTAPLIATAFTLIARGIGCVVLGKDIGAGLVTLIKKRNAKGIDNLLEKLREYEEREVAKFMARGEEQKAETVTDKVDCIVTVIENLDDRSRTVPALIAKIESMFSDSNGVLTLSTQHKAKGREWHTVAILRPDLNPSKWARQEWQRLQEENLMYVAWTRSTSELIFIQGEG